MINPVLIYVGTWLFVLLLYLLGLTSNLVPVPVIGMFVIVLNLLGIGLIYMLLTGGRALRPVVCRDELYIAIVRRFLKFCIFMWAIGTAVEIYVGRGFPLYWRYTGDVRLYTDFGIPSFHGVMNALYLQSLSMAAYLLLKLKQKRWLLLALILLSWPVAMLGRGILLSGLLQMTCVWLLLTRVTLRKFGMIIAGALAVVVVFGLIGDMRQTENPFAYIVNENAKEIFSTLPSGFLWFYVYLTAGLSNFFYNIDSVIPTWNFTYSMSNMLPSVVRSYLDLDPRNDMFEFVDANLNTSTIYAGSVSDFGPLGGFLTVSLVQFVCCYIYIIAKQGRPWGLFAYTVAFQILIFSVFYDMFFLLPTLFQFAICLLLYLYYAFSVSAKLSRK
ncbi:O-antigen polymerase [Pseudomonas fluorescens]|uniref:O-antigen polymerase n=1 Tax=Pseudomonas fluorescens TaxID=294 RepID=UPI003525CB07